MDFGDEYYTKHKMFTCSAGDSQYCLGRDGTVHLCHYTFFYPYQEYWDEVKAQDLEEKEVIDFLDVVPWGDEVNHRYNRAFHDFGQLKVSAVTATILQMVKNGEIRSVYKDPARAGVLAMALVPFHYCPLDSISHYGTWHLVPASVIRVFANGAFEEVMKDVLQ